MAPKKEFERLWATTWRRLIAIATETARGMQRIRTFDQPLPRLRRLCH